MPLFRRTTLVAPVPVTKSDANVSLASTGTANWTDCDAGGSAASRPMDVVIPNCKIGATVSIQLAAFVSAGSAGLPLDAWTIVSGSPVHAVSGGASLGVPSWWVVAGASAAIGATWSYVVQSGDLENVTGGYGTVRLRLKYVKSTGTAGTINASSSLPWRMEGRGPFG